MAVHDTRNHGELGDRSSRSRDLHAGRGRRSRGRPRMTNMMQRSHATSLLFVLLPVVVASCTDEPPAADGGRVDLELSGASASNVDTTPLAPTDVGVVFEDAASHTRVIGVFAFEPASDGFERKAWQLALTIVGDPIPGTIYPIGTKATLAYDQLPSAGVQLGGEATSGGISVEAASGSSVTFSFSSIMMAPTNQFAT